MLAVFSYEPCLSGSLSGTLAASYLSPSTPGRGPESRLTRRLSQKGGTELPRPGLGSPPSQLADCPGAGQQRGPK